VQIAAIELCAKLAQNDSTDASVQHNGDQEHNSQFLFVKRLALA